jgi:hypothetical protein
MIFQPMKASWMNNYHLNLTMKNSELGKSESHGSILPKYSHLYLCLASKMGSVEVSKTIRGSKTT